MELWEKIRGQQGQLWKIRVNHRTRAPYAYRTQYTVYVIAQQTIILNE